MKSQRILIVKPSSMGDILHVFPALAFLREKLPGAVFDFVVHPAFAGILDYSPAPIRRKILFQRQRLGKVSSFPLAFLRLCRALRSRRYELVIDFQGLLRSGFCAAITRHTKVAGFAEPRERLTRIFYNIKVPVPAELHAVERNLRLAAAAIGLPAPATPPVPAAPPAPAGWVPPTSRPYLVVLPGARWHSKCFPPILFARIAAAVSEAHPEVEFLLLGAAGDRPKAETIRAHLPKHAPVTDLIGKTSERDLVEILRGAAAVICNDTGPMHIAAMLGRPIFAFFGATDPKRTGPWSPAARVYRQQELKCLGCLQRRCPKQSDGYPPCQRLDPQPIIDDIVRVLAPHPTNNGDPLP